MRFRLGRLRHQSLGRPDAGNSTYAEASGTATVTVTKLTPTVTVTLNPSSVGANTQITVTATVTEGSGNPTPTGDVYFPVVATGCGLTSGSCSITIGSAGLANGKDTITATYDGDAYYQSATGSAVETVNALTPTVKVTTSATTVSAAIPFQVAISITGSGATPTGSVTLTAYDLAYGFELYSLRRAVFHHGSRSVTDRGQQHSQCEIHRRHDLYHCAGLRGCEHYPGGHNHYR